jgi:hypothetical protein
MAAAGVWRRLGDAARPRGGEIGGKLKAAINQQPKSVASAWRHHGARLVAAAGCACEIKHLGYRLKHLAYRLSKKRITHVGVRGRKRRGLGGGDAGVAAASGNARRKAATAGSSRKRHGAAA